MTGLLNRVLLLDRAEQALQVAERDGHAVTLLFCDLDGFKTVNDTIGHAGGDAVLMEVADRLRSVVRAGDTVARLGGDEFVVLCPDLSGPEQVVALTDRLASVVGVPVDAGGRVFYVGVSIGVATSVQGSTVSRLLAEADAAMYLAKAAARGSGTEPVSGAVAGQLVRQRRAEETDVGHHASGLR